MKRLLAHRAPIEVVRVLEENLVITTNFKIV